MATFDGERFVLAQLESIAAQTRLPDEVVVFDDGSSDATVGICREFARQAPFAMTVRVNAERLGYARNFERALMETSGEYVFLSDQDDVWYPNKIEVMVAALEAVPGTFVAIHDLRYCDAEMTPTNQTKLQRVRWMGGAERSYVTGMATVVRGELLRCALPLPDGASVTHDAWLHACGEALGGRRVVPRVLADYRRHGANATLGLAVNAPGRVRPTQLTADALAAPSVNQVAARERFFTEVSRWLSQSHGCIERRGLAGHEAVMRAASDWALRAEWARRRLELLSSSRRRRLLPVLRLWISGGYRPFSGWRSALKDLVSA